MVREIPEEFLPAYNAGYSIGYRQAKRELNDLTGRDKPLRCIDLDNERGYCKRCNAPVCITAFYCWKCGQRLAWSE